MSSETSCTVIGIFSTSCTSWTVVNTRVVSPIKSYALKIANSRSEYPPPFPTRPPFVSTATDPAIFKSIFSILLGFTILPN